MRLLLAVTLIVSSVFIQSSSSNDHDDSHRFKRAPIVGGFPASSPPPPRVLNFDYEDSIPDQPSSTTSTTPEPDFENVNEDAIVFPRKGRRRAEVTGTRESDGHYSFKGIRYAQAPVGRYRFQRPVRMYMSGKISATRYGPPCPQPFPNNKGYIGEEDCLYLNVFTPKIPLRGQKKSQGLPVIFWVHGGGFRRGSGAQYNPRNLVNKGVVVVTIQYRLGSLGYLSTKTKELPGNVGLFDINAAMRWTRDYIRFFGGNPDRIIASGQGSGASAAGMCANNRYNKDCVKGVFAMSGSSVSSFAVDEKTEQTSKEVGELNACQNEQGIAFVRCMQALPVEKLIEADNQYQDQKVKGDGPVKAMATPLNPSPTVDGKNDGRFLPFFVQVPPIETLKSGKFLKVPLLTGVTKEETSTAVKGSLFNQLLGKAADITQMITGSVFKELVNVNTGLYSNGSVNPSLDKLFSSSNYIDAVGKSLSAAASSVDKMIEATTDALFNLPAFLTSQLWTKHSKAYMYLFDHQSKKSTGKHFLDGLPLVQTSDDVPSKGLGHGDDLIYLFEPCSLQGEPIQSAQLTDESDQKVREHFTTMVAEFARSGEPKIPTAGVRSWKPFDADTSEYLQISDRPAVKTGFRKCQMALWAGIGETLKSAECQLLGAGELVGQLTGLASSGLLDPIANTEDLSNALTNPLKTLTNNPVGGLLNNNPVGELLGGGGNNNKNPVGGLLGGGGAGNTQSGGGRRTTTPKPQAGLGGLGNIFG